MKDYERIIGLPAFLPEIQETADSSLKYSLLLHKYDLQHELSKFPFLLLHLIGHGLA